MALRLKVQPCVVLDVKPKVARQIAQQPHYQLAVSPRPRAGAAAVDVNLGAKGRAEELRGSSQVRGRLDVT